MYLRNLADNPSFKLVTGQNHMDKEINGLYCCDLLSWVMSHAKQGDAWITVQTHVNIVAVASLLELTCIIIPEDNEVELETIEKANEESIPIFTTSLNSYQIFSEMYKMGLR